MNKIYFNSVFKKFLRFYLITFLLPLAYCTAQYRPSLFLKEDWKEIPAATPVKQAHVVNKDLILGLYGTGCDSIKKSHHDAPADDPYYIWSGTCPGNWAVTLKNTKSYVDLSSYGKIMWRSRQSGTRCLHVVLKLADGTWLVGSQGDCLSRDWRITEFNIADIEDIADMKEVAEQLIALPNIASKRWICMAAPGR